MIDEFSGQRLPDLPNAGYASNRAKETSDALMIFLRMVERNRMLLLRLVIDGPDKFVKIGRQVWRGLLIDRDLLLATYHWLRLNAGENPEMQLLNLEQAAYARERMSWDQRQRTRVALMKETAQLQAELLREQRKPRKTYSN